MKSRESRRDGTRSLEHTRKEKGLKRAGVSDPMHGYKIGLGRDSQLYPIRKGIPTHAGKGEVEKSSFFLYIWRMNLRIFIGTSDIYLYHISK
jgi:hypothetical protein